ncbi:MAG: 50S ribosomal protein L20 [Elusimicrobia bacterium RIFCSPLOWO2_01_FULL_54_10]|nr:MAG: 50S ribosomal protein L20 [Elusimicrobia bacterium RIFCSPLOWO2_01_FULL_54_10]
MRIKGGVYTRQRKKKILRMTSGYYSDRNNRWRQALQQVRKSMEYMYVDRKDRKGEFRELWITRINAAVRPLGLSYSDFISKLKKSNIQLNRKMLSELAINDAPAFQEVVKAASPN